MADWYGNSRSNYFKVKDEVEFREWADCLSLTVWEKDGGFAIAAICGMGGWPLSRLDDNDDSGGVNIPEELSKHLAEDEVAILMEVGAEKLRYVTGIAIAISWTGGIVQINLDDIYALAQEKFGDANITRAEY
jgi:hypothetical protein